MQIKKNDECELEITDMSTDGEGIGHANGMTFFVKGAVIGDKILAGVTKLKKTYGYARIVRILKPSADRVAPACPIASRCGGCSLQHLSYSAQLEFKQKKVFDALTRIGGIARDRFVFDGDMVSSCEENTRFGEGRILFYDIIGMDDPFHYRNKGQFPVGCDKDGKPVCGFYAKHSHDIVNTESCLLQHNITDALMAAVREYMTRYNVEAYKEGNISAMGAGAGIVRHVLTRVGYTTHEIMVCVVIAADELPYREQFARIAANAVEKYNIANNTDYSLNSVSYNINKADTNVILGDKVVTIAGLPFITDYIGDLQFRISPLSFYQVNPVQTEELYATALEFASPDENDTVWDLYCGIGTISLYFAKYVKKVYGIEIVPQAIEDAKENAKMNGITNAEFMCGAAEELFPELMRKESTGTTGGGEDTPDIVIVDPPRKGCDAALIECVGNLAPKKIVYVSCDPATLARDIKLLGEYGYEPLKVRPCDMFPQSTHVETVVCLSQQINEPARLLH